LQSQRKRKRNFKKYPTARQKTMKNEAINRPTNHGRQGSTGGNSTYPKVAIQWFNQAMCFHQSFCLVDSLVLRNRQLLVAAKRWQ
jgi:predicted acyl esterase